MPENCSPSPAQAGGPPVSAALGARSAARGSSLRKDKQSLRSRMRGNGQGSRLIAAELALVFGLRPRTAWREAHGWSLTEAASRINLYRSGAGIDAAGFSGMTSAHLSEHETWPGYGARASGRRPSLQLLAVLAAVYQCELADLIDAADRAQLPPADLLVIDCLQTAPPFQDDSQPAGEELFADEISDLVTWTETSNLGAGTIAYLDGAVRRLAHDCLTAPPERSRDRAIALARRVSGLLRGGHQRIGQTRDLYLLAGKLCALLSWLSGDLGGLTAADAYCRSGWALAEEAGHPGLRALLLSAESKNAYWSRRYDDAASAARRGYDHNPAGTVRVLLACQEADAHQAVGKTREAEEALSRAEQARTGIDHADELGGIFACGPARQANYSISASLRIGAVGAALQHAESAEMAWRDGDDWAFGTWAQVQIAAATAYIMDDEIDRAAIVLEPVLSQPEEKFLATLTTRLAREVVPLLTDTRRGRAAASLGNQIQDVCAARSAARPLLGGTS
jgi:hypothetical protein